jgi:DNA-binding CsgD family transcriptional regulator
VGRRRDRTRRRNFPRRDHGVGPGRSTLRLGEVAFQRPEIPAGLADRWGKECRSLRAANIAHGDLQHGNVMADDAGNLTFIDLGGVWVPAIDGRPLSEFGHPNFQHPDRTEGKQWGLHIDWFSALVIWVSLRALAADPILWRYNDENLIFKRKDFRGATGVWNDLKQNPDEDVRAMMKVLAAVCEANPMTATDLNELLNTREAPGGSASTTSSGAPTKTNDDAGAGTNWREGPATAAGRASASAESGVYSSGPSANSSSSSALKQDVNSSWSGSQGPPNYRAQSGNFGGAGTSSGPGQHPLLPGVALTPRQMEVVDMACQGYDIDGIASQLGVGISTIGKPLSKVASVSGIGDKWQLLQHLSTAPPSSNSGGNAAAPPGPTQGQAHSKGQGPPVPKRGAAPGDSASGGGTFDRVMAYVLGAIAVAAAMAAFDGSGNFAVAGVLALLAVAAIAYSFRD